MRQALERATSKLKIQASIVCHSNISCETYWPPIASAQAKNPLVVAGHFYAPLVDRWEAQRVHTKAYHSGVKALPLNSSACLVILRATVPRVRSCWNYRFVQTSQLQGARLMSNMTEEEVEWMLPGGRSKVTEGCNNEAARVFSQAGLREDMLGKLTLDGAFSTPVSKIVAEIVQRLSNCVVGILERCNDTMANIRRHLPWLVPHYHCDLQMIHAATTRDTGTLSAGLSRVILRQNAVDETVYHFANELLNKQLDKIGVVV